MALGSTISQITKSGLKPGLEFPSLVVAGVLNSALSLYYYLKIIRYMYLYDPDESSNPEFPNSVRYVSLGVILLLAVFFPLYWESLFELCKEASSALME